MHFFPSLPYLWKESLNSEGQQFHIYQQKNSHLSPKTIEHKKKDQDISLIQKNTDISSYWSRNNIQQDMIII
jgi:hypothetical protein